MSISKMQIHGVITKKLEDEAPYAAELNDYFYESNEVMERQGFSLKCGKGF
jgi:hypothetical protein